MLRSVEFRHTFPDEWRFDSNDIAIGPGARELAEEIVAALGLKADEITRVEQHSYYGWAFDARFGECWFDHVLNPADDRCWLTIVARMYWLKAFRFRRNREAFDRYCVVLGEVLEGIAGVSEVVWPAPHFLVHG